MPDISTDDIRAAVAADILSERQATDLAALADRRGNFRENMRQEDEPFELFKGFAEIFVTVGLALLTGGFVSLATVLGNPVAIPLGSVLLSLLLGRYFTLKRRMVLPSIFLVLTFSMSVYWLVWSFATVTITSPPLQALVLSAVAGAAIIGHFAVFRVPFSLFLVGLSGLGSIFSITVWFFPGSLHDAGVIGRIGWHNLTDIGTNPIASIALLLFGILTFLMAMRFDMRDPYRVTRNAANAFWLHILAAPAIVNVVSGTLLGVAGTGGYILSAIALVGITVLALIIDRRSFLSAGIAYIGIILTWALGTANVGDGWMLVWTFLLMGAFITAIGSWWTALRGRVMRLIPNSRLKSKLPPVSEGA